ncbi:had-superfamily subfamily variant 1 [Colletotrichum karsti]|uniref:Had-superfamily subfamily variant 1 n=1 Tax=Colletotrichum karsti TaxID=1095194 RepID=A0A9P6HYE6_9PEZI|nr:had-superfamily subfamily variant 1 [Colletotrichum karsti]KAF9871391.1 had-superfamily subfamily variant 1 [Colletotrichum karsti]
MAQPTKLQQFQTELNRKSWFGFDLDDTLHEFRRASSAATNQVIQSISQRHGTPVQSLKDEYSTILREKTSSAFADGKTSIEYRRERFSTLLERFFLPLDAAFIEQLLDTYEKTLAESLKLKDGALSLLSMLKKSGKKVAVITEGPQDAQERTVKHLGIADHIDLLATTNFFGVSKTEGLFPKVLDHLGISAADMVYVGDNAARDVVPAEKAGILCIHYNEQARTSFDEFPARLCALGDIESMLL